MHVIIDIVIVAVLVIFLIIGIKRGFMQMLLSFLGIVIAIAIGFALRGPVRKLLDKTPWEANIASGITEMTAKAFDSIKPSGEEELTKEEQETAVEKTSIPRYITDAIKKWAANNIAGGSTDAEAAKAFGAKAASFIMDAIAVLIVTVIAIAIIIIIKLIVKATRKLHIPVLHQLDSFGGGVLGILVGAAILYGLIMLVGVLASCGYLTKFSEALKKSFIGGFMYNFNLIGTLTSWFSSWTK